MFDACLYVCVDSESVHHTHRPAERPAAQVYHSTRASQCELMLHIIHLFAPIHHFQYHIAHHALKSIIYFKHYTY